jgi:hypothetical protein
LAEELSTARFGDERLTRRLQAIVTALAQKPNVGFPMALGSEAASEGFYRFLRNEKVNDRAILKPHIDATLERCAEARRIVIVHDTTQFQFSGEGEREGLGTTGNRTHKGFFGHFALALDPACSNKPLGVVGLKTFSRTHKKYSRGSRAAYLRGLRRDPTKESLRWGDLVEEVESSLANDVRAVHVMDRESDSYVLLSRMLAAGASFVIRVTAKRRLFPLGDEEPVAGVYEEWEDLPDMLEREVPLSARKKSSPYYCAGRHPVRRARMARLRIAAKRIRAKRSSGSGARWPASLEINAVRVYEVDPPHGEEPVEWLLLTNEPIASKKDVASVVDSYRARWVIEEYFKALKTGCAFEQRQLESYGTLRNALAILAPIAWKILLLRSLERAPQSVCVSDAASRTQIEVLRAFSSRPPPEPPTVTSVLSAIAALGGHLTSNGPPGWQVLWRGYQELVTLERAWVAARNRSRCDQS